MAAAVRVCPFSPVCNFAYQPVSISGCLGLRIGSLLIVLSSHLASRMSCFRRVSQFELFSLRRTLAA
eukprot:scaffold274484_cov19-Tisochrysis_lutea.AAC.1